MDSRNDHLRRLALAALEFHDDRWTVTAHQSWDKWIPIEPINARIDNDDVGEGEGDVIAEYIVAAQPANILALLDELEQLRKERG